MNATESSTDTRARTQRRIAVFGGVGAVALTLAVGLSGGSGQAGMAVLLVVLALTSAFVAVYGFVTAVVDEIRSREVSRTRILQSALAFFGAAALMAMVASVGG